MQSTYRYREINIKNLILHITLPKGLGLADGRTLQNDLTLDIVSKLDPYYCSVDQVRLAGGQILRKLSDLTIACQIFQSSQEVKLITPTAFSTSIINDVPRNNATHNRFIGSRNQWVTAAATRDLILSQATLLGGPQSHVLANFSVEKSRGFQTEGIPAKLKELEESIKLYDPTIRSAGNIMPGGKARSGMAAKGVYDWSERTPARLWTSTGLGANSTSWDFGSPTGGRGKPTKFYASPYYSQPLLNMRNGLFSGVYPLQVSAMYSSQANYPMGV